LFVLAGDGRYDLDAGEDNGIWESQSAFSNPPARIEWRLRGTRPRAIIYRLSLTGDGNDGRSVLGVETIARPGHWAGCLVAWIDGALPDANMLARNRADADHTQFRCGHDEPEQVTR
jgi:triacylglycerol esterase/lipase EstA (alpha/beta hydrolase family)